MNDFNITLTIEDLIYSNNCCDKETTTLNVKNINDTISLKCGYILNVIRVSNNFFTVLIQNGINTYIRNVFTNYPMQLCIGNNLVNHVITISGTING